MQKHSKSLLFLMIFAAGGVDGLLAGEGAPTTNLKRESEVVLSPEQTEKLREAIGDVATAMDDKIKKLEPLADGVEKMGDAANEMAEGMLMMIEGIEQQLLSIPPSKLTDKQKRELADLQAKKAQLKIDIEKSKREMDEFRSQKAASDGAENVSTGAPSHSGH